MVRYRSLAALTIAAIGFASAAVAQFDSPDPKVYARAEDCARAQLRGASCTEADIGRGCYRTGERLVRESPCSTHRDGVIHMLPTPQRVGMTRPQRFRDIWLDDFEAQAFIPASSTPPVWPDNNLPLAERRAQYERYRAATIWLDLDRDKLPAGCRGGARRSTLSAARQDMRVSTATWAWRGTRSSPIASSRSSHAPARRVAEQAFAALVTDPRFDPAQGSATGRDASGSGAGW